MAHIKVADDIPGIRSLIQFRPETGKPLLDLAQALMRGASSLTEAERELIAAYVSHGNECRFCTYSHAAAARHLYKDGASIVDEILKNVDVAPISDKMRALLNIAEKVRIGGKSVTDGDVALAREYGADDLEIHDTVLIAAAFSMYNRYVDGLASLTPTEPEAYIEMGRRMAEKGYAM